MDILLTLVENLSFYVEHQKTVFLGPFLQNQAKIKFQFFNLNHGLTPLEKSLLWWLCKMNIFIVCKAFVSIQNIRKKYF